MRRLCDRIPSAGLLLLALLVTAPRPGSAQGQNAKQVVQTAVNAELAADTNDHSNWVYRDHDVQPGKDDVSLAVETPKGTLKRTLMVNGQALTGERRDAESERMAKFVNDTSAQAKRQKASQHDDEQAAELLRMLPTAFLWTIRSETPDLITLDYKPNPDFDPPDMQARVMSSMAGEMVIARSGDRIRTLRGKLTNDVKIGFGILGKLNQGGTFQIERREVAPGSWQITETHVHIGGHALLFKTIGQHEDEVKTEWKPSPAKTLQEAEEYLRTAK